jgi:hypothetical protein
MEMSKHASKRSQQRGIPKSYAEIILKYGNAERKPGNVFEYRLPKRKADKIAKQFKHLIQSLDKCTRKGVLVDLSEGKIITVYNLT